MPSKTVKIICLMCGGEGNASKQNIQKGLGKFCSKGCASKHRFQSGENCISWKGGKETKECLTCKKTFQRWVKNGKSGKYCSMKCRGEDKRGANSYHWNGENLKLNCLICKKDFTVRPLKNEDPHYCSRICANTGIARRVAERKKLTRVPKTCVICGKIKLIKPSKNLAGQGTYCSRECMAIGYSKINMNTNAYSRTKSGKREDLNGLFVRSSWEANYARYLNWLISVNQISSWEYEKDTFEFPIKRGSKFYTPDFKVFNLDATFEYHEVKGWMDAKSKTKLSRMKRYYPAIKLVLIGEKPYKEIASKVGRMIPNWEGGK